MKKKRCDGCRFWALSPNVNPHKFANAGTCTWLLAVHGVTPFWVARIMGRTFSWEGEGCDGFDKIVKQPRPKPGPYIKPKWKS